MILSETYIKETIQANLHHKMNTIKIFYRHSERDEPTKDAKAEKKYHFNDHFNFKVKI